MGVLWSVLPYCLTLYWTMLMVSCQVFSNTRLDDMTFTDSTLFTWPSRSLLHCTHLCGVKPTCLTFTFCPPSCQGHYDIMTSDSNHTTAVGCRTYVRRNTAVRCWESEGVQTVAVPALGLLNVVCHRNWIVCLRRQDGSVDFYRNWNNYTQGFGNLTGEFWLGLQAFHYITRTCVYKLKVDLGDWEGNFADALYANFSVGPEQNGYTLHLDWVNGTANDSLGTFNDQKFSTWDRDQDTNTKKNCAVKHQGAWWYMSCVSANLCGFYYNVSGITNKTGITWKSWHGTAYSLKSAQLQIRPNEFC